MNTAQILGTLRHGLTFLGGILVTRGFVDESLLEELIGSFITIVGGSWSMYIKLKKDNKKTDEK
jgi:hypothetical protein